MLLLRTWNRLLALTLLSGALLCILAPNCDGIDLALASQQQISLSNQHSSNSPDTPSEAECWCCCAHVITTSFQVPMALSPLMRTDAPEKIQYLPVDLPTPTQPPRV
jgi:hypothetical protein